MCVCVCVCVYARQRGRERARARNRQTERQRKGMYDDDCFYYHSWRNYVVIVFGTLSSLRATTRYATMLSHLYLLSEWLWLVNTHFLLSPCQFQAPRTQGTAQSTPGTICCSLRHTTIITWSLQCSKIKSVIARTINLSHCAIYLSLLCWATPLWHADLVESLLYYSQPMRYYVEPLALCWTTMLSPSHFAEPLALAMPLVIQQNTHH